MSGLFDFLMSFIRCRLYHNWNEWKTIEEGHVTVREMKQARYLYQQRECVNCKKQQLNKVDTRYI